MNRQKSQGPDRKGAKTPGSIAQIEDEIGRVRGELNSTLDALGAKLAWRPLLHRGMEMVTGYSGAAKESGPNHGERRRVSPIALGMIGAGVAWLVADYAGFLPGVKPAQRRGADGEQRIDDDEPARPGGKWLSGGFESKPLAVGLLGLVAGAAAAALLPPTEGERDIVDRAREDLWQRAEDLAHRTAEQVRGVADCSTRRGATDRD